MLKIKVGDWEECPKCYRIMERRKHNQTETAYLTKAYYYTQWDYCKWCKHVQHYEKFKVIPPKISPSVKNVWDL